MGLNNLLQKKWFLALLIILLIVETSLLVIIIVQSFQGRQTFPGLVAFRYFEPQCATLSAETFSETAENRTVRFTCDGRAALAMNVPFQLFPQRDAPIVRVVPTFSLPPGYMRLYLTTASLSDCSYQYYALLNNGEAVAVGGSTWAYVYCAIVDNSVSQVSGFTITWSPGEPPTYRPAPVALSASPSTITISAGQTANSTITVTGVGGFSGNVSFYGQMVAIDYRAIGGPITFSFSPRSVLVEAGGSNSTTLMVPTKQCTPEGGYCTPPGRTRVEVFASTKCLVVSQGYCLDGYAPAYVAIIVDVT